MNKVEKPTVVDLDDEENKTILCDDENNDNRHNLISNFESNDDEEDNFFVNQIEKESKTTPKTTLNSQVVRGMKNLQASFIESVNKIEEQAAQEKVQKI